MKPVTDEQLMAGFNLVMLVADTIRQAGEIPSGHLYATVMGTLPLEAYNTVIEKLKKTGLVTEKNHLLKWVGPVKE